MQRSNQGLSWLSAVAVGSGLTYLFDRSRGKRRQAQVRDKFVHAERVARRAADKTWRDLEHRAIGIVAEVRSAMTSHSCPDDILIQRVRARLGRACSHANSIDVHAQNGRVTLSGPILEREADLLLQQVRSVRGVREVEDRLERHQSAEHISGLQGESARRRGQSPDILQGRWAPATRLMVGTVGLVSLIRGLRRGGIVGIPEAALGTGLLLRASTNLELGRVFGISSTRSAVRMQKTITIHAPIEQVFNLWSRPENFPRFMSHVKEVRRVQEGRYHWTVVGPAGTSVGWDAEVTENVPRQVLAWKSVPGSTVRNAGTARFTESADGGTRIHVLMSYNPPAGAVGHVLASIFGDDPKNGAQRGSGANEVSAGNR